MTYRPSSFGATTLPTRDLRVDISSDLSKLGLVPLPGAGWFDAQLTEASPAEPPVIKLFARMTAAALATLSTNLDTLRARVGRRDTLTITLPGGSTRWRYARLVGLQAESRAEHHLGANVTQPVELTFQCVEAWWRGAAHDVDVTLTGPSPQSMVMANAGNRTVNNAIITVAAVPSNITSLTIAVTGSSSFTFSGTITAGQSLVIDCGAMTVKNNGADAYANFALGGSHVIDDWLRLVSGNTTVVVTWTGGGATSTINFTYDDGYY